MTARRDHRSGDGPLPATTATATIVQKSPLRIRADRERIVYPHEHACGRHAVTRGSARGMTGDGGECGGIDTFARHVADDQRPAIVGGLHDVEEIAADVDACRRRQVPRRDLEAWDLGKARRQQASLQRLCHPALPFVQHDVVERRADAPGDIERERDIGGAVAPTRFGLHQLERTERALAPAQRDDDGRLDRQFTHQGFELGVADFRGHRDRDRRIELGLSGSDHSGGPERCIGVVRRIATPALARARASPDRRVRSLGAAAPKDRRRPPPPRTSPRVEAPLHLQSRPTAHRYRWRGSTSRRCGRGIRTAHVRCARWQTHCCARWRSRCDRQRG